MAIWVATDKTRNIYLDSLGINYDIKCAYWMNARIGINQPKLYSPPAENARIRHQQFCQP